MIQCKDCEFCEMAADGQAHLKCNPFTNVREAECLTKWELLRLDMMTRAYMLTIAEYRKIAPLQERLYRRMSREMDELDESDSWKAEEEDGPEGEGGPDDTPLDDRL